MTASKDLPPRVALAAWLAERAALDGTTTPDACRCRTPSVMRYLRQSWCRLCGREIAARPKPTPGRAGRAQDARGRGEAGRC